MATLGIRTLRNEVAYVGQGPDRIAIMGLDWIRRPGSRDFYSYPSAETARHLARMSHEIPSETPTVLLAHHPDTFGDIEPFDIGLTLSGYSHGGGQVVFFTWDGAPVGISSSRFRYVSGPFEKNGRRLYVNRVSDTLEFRFVSTVLRRSAGFDWSARSPPRSISEVSAGWVSVCERFSRRTLVGLSFLLMLAGPLKDG